MAEVTCIVDTAATAWVASTAYDTVGTVVTNDSGRRYTLTTAGTSASSGGPTGTGTGITDGTCVWDYYLIHYTSLSAAITGETGASPLVVTSDDLRDGVVTAVSVNAGGTGYAVDDVLTLTNAAATDKCTVTVTAVDAEVVTGISLTTGGHEYSVQSYAVTGGTGNDDATINVTSVKAGEQLTFSCRASRNPNGTHTADTAAVDLAGFIVDATNHIKIVVPAEHRHAGVWDDTKFRVIISSAYVFRIGAAHPHTRVIGLQLQNTGDSDFRWVADSYSANCIFDSCLFTQLQRVHYANHLYVDREADSNTSLINCIGNEGNRGFDLRGSSVYNCLLYGLAGLGYRRNDGTVTITNCVACNVGGNDFDNSPTVSYCASDSGGGTNAVTLDNTAGYSNEFEDAAGGDFRLVSGSGCIDAGTDLSATFEHDIIGTTRPQGTSWDIGAFEFEDAGATATGSATISLSSSGATTRTLGASGAASISATATGASTRTLGASGAPTASLSSDGSASRAVSGSGDTTLDIVASGSGSFLAAGITASGSASIDVTASGEASRRPGGSGAASVSLSAVGAAIRALVASGAASITLSSVGTAATEAKSASGSASIGVSSSGSTTRRLTALGAPGITLSPSGSGSVIGVVSAQGQAQVALSATGVATRSLSCVGSATVALASTGTDLSTTTTEQRLQNIESLVEMIFARVYS